LALAHDHPPTDPAPLGVEVHFDFLCPWCLIGKRQLDAATRRFEALVPTARVEVAWRSHELLPDTPPDGLDYESFYIHRLGSPEAVALRRLQVREAGLAAGVHFEFDRIRRLPNTAHAHALLAQAQAQAVPGLASRLVERVLTAYFLEGQDIGAPAVLERLGRACGLPEAAFEAAGSVARAMHAGNARPAGHGIGGVPFFVFDRKHALSGAGSVAALLEALLETWQERMARGLPRAGGSPAVA
jgi:predicted DsbA family dithiol-disulfide isomerase